MTSSQNVILALAPGKRELGIAVFVGVDLVYVSVKTLKNRKSRKLLMEEISDILQKLFESFPVKTVVVKAISQYQKLSPDLDLIAERIKFESRKENLQVAEVTLEQIKFVLCKSEKATEKRAFGMLLVSFPELKKYWNRPNKWQSDYYAFLMSAVAVGVVHLKNLSERD